MTLTIELPTKKAREEKAAGAWSDRFQGPAVDVGVHIGCNRVTLVTPGQILSEPARLAVDAKGRILAMGQRAVDLAGREARGVRIIPPMREGIVADLDWAGRLLEHRLQGHKRARAKQARAVVAWQSDLSTGERQALIDVYRAAGIKKLYPLDRALVAAVGADAPILRARGTLIVHMGAGSSQASVVSLGGVVTSRSIRIGGDHMTAALQEHVRRKHQVLIDEREAESLKHVLGCALPLEPVRRHEVVGRELARGCPVKVELDSQEVYELLEPLVGAVVHEARLVLAEISPELLRDVVADGIVLTGGGASLHRLDELLRQETRVHTRVCGDPQNAVARGLQRILQEGTLRQSLLSAPQERPLRAGFTPVRKLRGALAALLVLVGTAAFTFYGSSQAQAFNEWLDRMLQPGVALAGARPAPPAEVQLKPERERQLSQLTAENQRLWKMLGRQTNQPVPPVVARVVARDPKGWMSYLKLDAGSQQGVQKGMAVRGPDGLVGRVADVAATSSKVRLFTDPGSVVAARVKGRNTGGVVTGQGRTSLEMRYLDPNAGVKAGDLVITSGQDGHYPAGLALGRIARILPQTDSSFVTAVVEPATRFNEVKEVALLRGTR